jgi:phosphoglycolate phosphatase
MESCGVSEASVKQAGAMPWPEAILFDLDGTLIDSVPDLAAATNELLALDNLPPQTVDAVRSMIGNGVKKLVERAYAASGAPAEGQALEELTNRMMAIYGRHLTRHTTLMPSAGDIVATYHQSGVRIGVVTNKPEAFTHQLLKHFGLDDRVAVVVGGDTGPERKPAPDMLDHALSVLGLSVGRALMVGDSPADIDAARAARMASVAVRGGYTNVSADDLGADFVIDSLAQLPSAIEALKKVAVARS